MRSVEKFARKEEYGRPAGSKPWPARRSASGNRTHHEIRAAALGEALDFGGHVHGARIPGRLRAAAGGEGEPLGNGISGGHARPSAPHQHGEHEADGTLAQHRPNSSGCGSACTTALRQVFSGSTSVARSKEMPSGIFSTPRSTIQSITRTYCAKPPPAGSNPAVMPQSHYAGPAPVSLESYVEQIRNQSVRKVEIHEDGVQRAFAHLVIGNEVLRKFGTALNSGSSIFLYGPPGTGKTTIAETLSRVIAQDAVWIPYAIEVDGQIITVYDSAIHKRVAGMEPEIRDERWVLCERPAVLAGGELTIEMLDMQFNPVTKFYVAPIQMKANNGVLIIDDFGRQRMRPEDLLNRWVVPLDRRIDFLTLSGGKKIEVPFEMLVVFASNMDPAELVDACFLRRIQTKIKIGTVSDSQFCEIFRRVVDGYRLRGFAFADGCGRSVEGSGGRRGDGIGEGRRAVCHSYRHCGRRRSLRRHGL